MGKWRRGRRQATQAERGSDEKKKAGGEEEEKNTNLDDLVLKLMAIVGCCRNLTALRGPPSTINTAPDINNNT